MDTIYKLTLKDVELINNKIKEYIIPLDKGVSVSVVDSHGELLSFFRTDKSPLSSINISINKAFTAARDKQTSGELGENSKINQFNITDLGDIRYTGLQGGVPIIVNNEVIGAVAVSGMSGQEDEELARLGISALTPKN